MKKIILLLLISVITNYPIIAFTNIKLHNRSFIQNVDNGWYKANVKYQNPGTYTKSTYTLNVKVQYNTVVAIDFGNGGSVHSGINNEGYFYSGGILRFEKDFEGNIIGATTRVSISEGGSTRYFDISL